MQFKTLIAATLASTAAAAPALIHLSGRDIVGQWTYRATTLTCSDDTHCTWQLNIDTGNGNVVPCSFAEAGTTASVPDTQCGGSDFFVSLGWNPQGFWTMAVKDLTNRLISYPAYNTGEIQPNGPPAPDRTFNVETLNV